MTPLIDKVRRASAHVTHPLRLASPPTAAPRPWWYVRRCWRKRPRPRSTPAARCRQCWAGWWWRETGYWSESAGTQIANMVSADDCLSDHFIIYTSTDNLGDLFSCTFGIYDQLQQLWDWELWLITGISNHCVVFKSKFRLRNVCVLTCVGR